MPGASAGATACALLILALGIGSVQAANEPPDPVGGSPNVTIGGKPALRQGDGVAGGTSPNVFINGRPAALQGSTTDCGGVVVGGTSNVMINGRAAASAGSATTPCPGKVP
jgi:uncharacterized Zn-binding protein involved in type VI secretion